MSRSGPEGRALQMLLRIRRSSLDDAQRAVAEALQTQQQLQAQSEAEEARYAMETAAALDIASGDETVDAFARWLPVGRRAVETARQAEREASGNVDNARIVLGLARAACRSVEKLIEIRTEQDRQTQDRKAQLETDEVAGRSRLT